MGKSADVTPMILVSIGIAAILLVGWIAPDQSASSHGEDLPGVAGVAAASAGEATKVPIPPLPDLKPNSVALGAQVYTRECASCHGQDLKGATNWKTPNADGTYPSPPHDDSGHTWHHPDHLLYSIILDGGNGNPGAKSNMPAYRGRISGPELVGVLDYIKSRWSPEKRQYQWEMTMMHHE
jgi:mono/diheme cytochrome c family protein